MYPVTKMICIWRLCLRISLASSEQFLFEQAYDRTQILFLDIEMEKMDGIALAREIRKHNRQMQIIFVTGYMEYIQEGYDVEALHYLLKPVSQEKIDSVLDRAVERLKTAYAVLLVIVICMNDIIIQV